MSAAAAKTSAEGVGLSDKGAESRDAQMAGSMRQ